MRERQMGRATSGRTRNNLWNCTALSVTEEGEGNSAKEWNEIFTAP